MLNYDKARLIPLCPKCKKELKEIQAKSFNTNYYEFDFETREYKPMPGTKVEDDNLFHCSECGYGIEVKELFDTLTILTTLDNTVKVTRMELQYNESIQNWLRTQKVSFYPKM